MQNEDQQPETAVKSHSNAPAFVVVLGIVTILAAVNFLAPGWTKVQANDNAKIEVTTPSVVSTSLNEATTAPVIEISAPVTPPSGVTTSLSEAAIPAVPDESLKVTEVKVESELAPITTTIRRVPPEHPLPTLQLIMGKMTRDAEGKDVFMAIDHLTFGDALAVKVELTEVPEDTKTIDARIHFPDWLRAVEKSNPDKNTTSMELGYIELDWTSGYEDQEVHAIYEFSPPGNPVKELEFKASFEWHGDDETEHKVFAEKIFAIAPAEHPMPAIRLVLGDIQKDANGKESFRETGLIVAGQPFAIKVELTELPKDTMAIGARIKMPADLKPTDRSNPDKIPAKVMPGSMELAWMNGYDDQEVSVVYEFEATTSLEPVEFEAKYEWFGDTDKEQIISKSQSFTFLASHLPASTPSTEENLAQAK